MGNRALNQDGSEDRSNAASLAAAPHSTPVLTSCLITWSRDLWPTRAIDNLDKFVEISTGLGADTV